MAGGTGRRGGKRPGGGASNGDEHPWIRAGFGGIDSIEATLVAMPMLVDALWRASARKDEGPLEQLRRVAMSSPALTLASLDRLSGQLVQFLAVIGPRTRAGLLHEASDGEPGRLDDRVERMVTIGLVRILPPGHSSGDAGEPCIALDERYLDWVPLQLPSIRRHLDQVRSAELRTACSLLGLSPNGTDKKAMLEALTGVLFSRERLVDAVQRAHPQGEQLFVSVLETSASAQRVGRNAYADELPGLVSVVDLWQSVEGGRGYYANSTTFQAVQALQDRCLIGGQGSGPRGYGYGAVTWPWIETVVGLFGKMFRTWTELPASTVDPRPIDEPVGTPVSVVVATGLITERLAADRTEGKRSGDRRPPVKAIRRTGADLGLSAPLAELLTAVAIDIGILAPVDIRTETGSGRRRKVTVAVHWVIDPQRFAQWNELTPAERWLKIVRTWMSHQGSVGFDLRSTGARITAIAALSSLPEGTGIGAADLVPWLSDHHGIWAQPDEDVVRDLALLGVTSSGPVVGLSRAGRAMLAPSMSSSETSPQLQVLFGGDAAIVVQPDHTVICPADAPVEVLEMLTRIADRESDGSATVWRLSSRALASAAGELDADAVVGFLHQHSSVPVAANVERLVRDSLVSRRTARIEEISSMITCEDPAVLSAAVAVKAAKLQPLTETTAVSTLEPSKLRDVLRDKHVSTELSGLDGEPVVLGSGSASGELTRSWQARTSVESGPVRSPGPVPIGPAVVASYVGLVSGDEP